jgi:hypothetical protein
MKKLAKKSCRYGIAPPTAHFRGGYVTLFPGKE